MKLALVCIIGIATVFVGLICLILISYLMSFLCQIFEKPETETNPAVNPAQMPRAKTAGASAAIPNKQEILAAACTVIAEELGTDVSNIKVTSFKKL